MKNEAIVNDCVRECTGYAENMIAMCADINDAVAQAVNIVLDEPFYKDQEVDMNFRNAVMEALKEQLSRGLRISLRALQDTRIDWGYEIARFTSFNSEMLSLAIVTNGKEKQVSL